METLRSLTDVSNVCLLKRNESLNTVLTASAKNAVNVNYAIKEMIYESLIGNMTRENRIARIREIYSKDESLIGAAFERKVEALAKDIDRYLKSEMRKPIETPDAIRDVWGVDVEVNPDMAFMDGNTLEVVKFFNKKPPQLKKNLNLSLYAMLDYGKTLAEVLYPGRNIFVTSSFYYLRKVNDKENVLHPEKTVYDLDFFEEKHGKNIIRLSDYNHGDIADSAKRVSTLDTEYYNAFQDFKKGNAISCAKETCQYCSRYYICSREASKAPIPSVAKGYSNPTYTDEQKAVVEFEGSEGINVVRVNAGAGTGKTTTVTGRFIHDLKSGMSPREIVGITFTNAAAEEMIERVEMACEAEGIDIKKEDLNIKTFNALGESYLLDNYSIFGYAEEPTLLEPSDAAPIVEELILENEIPGLNYSQLRSNEMYVKGAVAVAQAVLEVFKTYDITSSDLQSPDKIAFILSKLSKVENFVDENVIKNLYPIYEKYEARIKEDNLYDYRSQESAFRILDTFNPEYFKHTGIKELIVDEAQDSNEPQMQIITILMKSITFKNLIVVGDDAQSIYGFRDATPENFINIDKVLGMQITDLFLSKNFRSTPQVIECANKICEFNKDRIPKKLVSCKPNGVHVLVKGYKSRDEEYQKIVDSIKYLLASGKKKPEDIAVIARTRSELEKVQELLSIDNIDSTILVPEYIKDNSRVRAVLCLQSFLSEAGDESSIATYINECLNGGWDSLKTGEKMQYIADYLVYAEHFKDFSSEEKYEAFTELVNRIPGAETDEVFMSFLDGLRRRHTWSQINSHLYKFNVFGDADTITKKMKYSGVSLTTAHSSKGLEWPVVFVSISKFDKESYHDAANIAKLEEERRLLFVCVTRAKDELYISGTYYCFGNYATFVKKDEPGTNRNILLQNLYDIYKKGDLVSEVVKLH